MAAPGPVVAVVVGMTSLAFTQYVIWLNGSVITGLQVFLATALTAALVTPTLLHDPMGRMSLYERQRSVAEVLQLAVRPDDVPSVPRPVLVRDLVLAEGLAGRRRDDDSCILAIRRRG